ncbi:hypothetical protein MKW98_032372, partial [Papaver atlanticum]
YIVVEPVQERVEFPHLYESHSCCRFDPGVDFILNSSTSLGSVHVDNMYKILPGDLNTSD